MELDKDLTEIIKVTVEQECEENCAMSVELFNAIIRRWKLSNQFLAAFLRRSMDTVKSYRYNRLAIPYSIGGKMRRLHVFLAMDKTDKAEKETEKKAVYR